MWSIPWLWSAPTKRQVTLGCIKYCYSAQVQYSVNKLSNQGSFEFVAGIWMINSFSSTWSNCFLFIIVTQVSMITPALNAFYKPLCKLVGIDCLFIQPIQWLRWWEKSPSDCLSRCSCQRVGWGVLDVCQVWESSGADERKGRIAGEPPPLASERRQAGHKSAPSECSARLILNRCGLTITLICLQKGIRLAALGPNTATLFYQVRII